MIQNLIFRILFFFFFEDVISGIFGHTTCLYSPTYFSGHYQFVFFNFLIFYQQVLKPTKTSEKVHSFYDKVLLKIILFMNLNSLEIENNMLLQHSQKPFSLYTFSSQYFSVWCQKKHLPCSISWRLRTAFLKHFKATVCIFLYISVRKFLFQRCSKILSCWREGWWSGWIISLTRIAVGPSSDVLQFFILIEIFGNSTIFQHFDTSIYNIKTVKFSIQFWLVVKFPIGSHFFSI